MITKLDLTKQENRAAIIKFFKEHYQVYPYLLPTDQFLKITNKEYFILHNDIDPICITSVKQLTKTLLRMESTVVNKKYRQQGVATRMNDYIENIAKKRGYKKITTNIFIDNIPSIMLKLKRGYLVEGLLRDHDDTDLHEYTLGKLL